jgi:hypothetical protein
MNLRKPPKLATWLLQQLGSGYHTDSLAGDLIEQFARGRSRSWYWWQVLIAILVSTKHVMTARLLDATRRVLFRLVAEASVVLVIVTFVDQFRRTHAAREMWTPTFMATVALLTALALVAFILSRKRFGANRRHAVIGHFIALFAVVALGAGSFTWADAARSTCKTESCVCSKMERAPITQAQH